MKAITKNFNIVFNDNGSIKYAQNRITGKFASHKLAMIEYNLEKVEDHKTILALSTCLASIIVTMCFMYASLDHAMIALFFGLIALIASYAYLKEKETSLNESLWTVQKALFHKVIIKSRSA